MKAKERARLLSGAAAVLLCIKLVIVAHGSLRIGATSLLQSLNQGASTPVSLESSKQAGIQAGSSALSGCCHSQCNGLKDSGLLCSCCAGPEKDAVVDAVADTARATGNSNALEETKQQTGIKGGSPDAAVAVPRSSLQSNLAGSQQRSGSKPVPARDSAGRQQQQQKQEKDISATRGGDEQGEEKQDKQDKDDKYGFYAGMEYPAKGSSCCHASCNGLRRANDGAYQCGCCGTSNAASDGSNVDAVSGEQQQQQPDNARGQPRAAAVDEEKRAVEQGGEGTESRVERSLHGGGAHAAATIHAQRDEEPEPAADSRVEQPWGGASSSINDDRRQGAVSYRMGEGTKGGATSRRTRTTRQPHRKNEGEVDEQQAARRGGGDVRGDAGADAARGTPNGSGVNPREISEGPMGTNTVFLGTHDEGGVHRVRAGRRGTVAYPRAGEFASRVAVESLSDESSNSTSASSSSAKEDRHPLSWDKSWWPAKGWILWALSGPTLTLLIFILNTWTQGWECGVIYTAILLPLDLMTFYFDLYAYDDGDLYFLELALAISLNMCLCVCLIPAYSASQMMDHERRSFGGGYYDPYGFTPPGHGYGATGGPGVGGGGYGGNYQPFRGEGQATGYGVRTERTQLV